MKKEERIEKFKNIRDKLLLKQLRVRMQAEVTRRLHIEKNRIHWEHVKNTTWALFLMMPYLLSEWTARAFNFYESFPSIDMLIHFSFGVAFVSVASLIYMNSAKSIGFWLVVTSFAWEGLEMIGDAILSQPSYHLDIFFWDGTIDILMNILGGVLVYAIFKPTGLFEHKI